MRRVLLTAIVVSLMSTSLVMAHCGVCGVGEAKGSMSGEETVAKKVSMMTEKLGLSEEQAAQVTAAIEEKHAAKKAAKEAFTAKLKEILTPEQYEKKEAMWEEKKGSHKGSGHEDHGSGHEDKGSH